uniref:hypothetical protein n=1 Tax=Candidatus Pantoea varia TaxID=1881036 RepID=UPI001587F52D|nr:hypothetical protein [Pantoea varia]
MAETAATAHQMEVTAGMVVTVGMAATARMVGMAGVVVMVVMAQAQEQKLTLNTITTSTLKIRG